MGTETGGAGAPPDPTTHDGAASDDGDDRAEDLPLPPYPPNLGHPSLHIVRRMPDVLEFGERAHRAGDVVRTRLPAVGDHYHFAHPEHAKRMLLTERERFRKSGDFRIAFGEGLLTVEGEEWKRQREALRPPFTRESVHGYADGMVEQVRRRSDRWTDGDRLDLQHELARMTLDVLFATVLGRELVVDGRPAAPRGRRGPPRPVRPDVVPPAAMGADARAETVQTGEGRATGRGRPAGRRAATGPADEPRRGRGPALAARRAPAVRRRRPGDVHRRAAARPGGYHRPRRPRHHHDDAHVRLPGARQPPRGRERFHEEVDRLDGPPTVEDLADLGVTERVVTETLRLYPPVYALPRVTTEPIAVDGYRVPADAPVFLEIRRIQRDPRFFDAPGTFRPSRWTGDLRRELHDFAYAPFGGGPRICIGREFALLEAKLALATVGREYRLYWLGENEPDGEPPVSPEMPLRMEEGEEFLVVER